MPRTAGAGGGRRGSHCGGGCTSVCFPSTLLVSLLAALAAAGAPACRSPGARTVSGEASPSASSCQTGGGCGRPLAGRPRGRQSGERVRARRTATSSCGFPEPPLVAGCVPHDIPQENPQPIAGGGAGTQHTGRLQRITASTQGWPGLQSTPMLISRLAGGHDIGQHDPHILQLPQHFSSMQGP